MVFRPQIHTWVCPTMSRQPVHPVQSISDDLRKGKPRNVLSHHNVKRVREFIVTKWTLTLKTLGSSFIIAFASPYPGPLMGQIFDELVRNYQVNVQ